METFYFYKMTTDSGGAPCVDNGLLSLAICKPILRRMACEGNIILGFGGKKLEEKLIYVAKISKIVVDGDYYRDNTVYSNRQDCIYCWHGDELVFKEDSKFHGQSHRNDDVGLAGQHKKHANVILAEEFVYFGDKGTYDYKNNCTLLKQSIEELRRGYRVNNSQELLEQLTALYHNCIKNYGKQKVVGRPHHKPDNSILCSETEGEVKCPPCSVRKTG